MFGLAPASGVMIAEELPQMIMLRLPPRPPGDPKLEIKSFKNYQEAADNLFHILSNYPGHDDYLSHQIMCWGGRVVEDIKKHNPDREGDLEKIATQRINELVQEIFFNPLDDSPFQEPVIEGDWVWEKWMLIEKASNENMALEKQLTQATSDSRKLIVSHQSEIAQLKQQLALANANAAALQEENIRLARNSAEQLKAAYADKERAVRDVIKVNDAKNATNITAALLQAEGLYTDKLNSATWVHQEKLKLAFRMHQDIVRVLDNHAQWFKPEGLIDHNLAVARKSWAAHTQSIRVRDEVMELARYLT